MNWVSGVVMFFLIQTLLFWQVALVKRHYTPRCSRRIDGKKSHTFLGRCRYGKLFFEFLPHCSYHGRVLIARKPEIFVCFGLRLAIRRALLMGCHEPSVTGAGTYYPGATRIYLAC